jgi:hypothetical protein
MLVYFFFHQWCGILGIRKQSMADFGDDEYKHMLCVEVANIEKAVTLKPGEEWKGRTCLCRRVHVGLLSLGYILSMFCSCCRGRETT